MRKILEILTLKNPIEPPYRPQIARLNVPNLAYFCYHMLFKYNLMRQTHCPTI